MQKFIMKPWDKANIYENTTPVREGDRVTAVIYVDGQPLTTTRNYGKEYEVKLNNSKLGIDWNDTLDPNEPCELFEAFESFSSNVEFTILDREANDVPRKWSVRITETFSRVVVISDRDTAEEAEALAEKLYDEGDIETLGFRDFTGETEIEVVEGIVTDAQYAKYESYPHFNDEGEMP